MNEKQHLDEEEAQKLVTKNTRLAIILGLVAVGFYVGFLLMFWK